MRKDYHFIGIGGIGMSALANILLAQGEQVSGSDIKDSPTIKKLHDQGAKIFIGHSPENIKKPYAIVYSTDIPKDNPEYYFAKEKGLRLLHRSELLAEMMGGFTPLLVTGTHGKTTTSSLLAHCLMDANLDPTYAVGGYLQGMGTNGRLGKGIYFIAEADESDGSFLNYPSFGAIITNLEHDHMNYWKTEDALLKAFHTFASQVGSKEHLFWCHDDMLLKSLQLEGYSYGFNEKADLVIDNFQQVQWKTWFDITFQGEHFRELEIPLIGAHNVLNAAAVFGLGLKLDVETQVLRRGLKSFQGVGRRVEKKGSVQDIDFYDDYAHHPTEIFATLRALKCATHGRRLVVAFQPHRFSRTQYCMDDFADAFQYADEVIITDIYAASEKPIPGITPEKIIKKIKTGGFKPVCFVERGLLPKFISQFLKKGDIFITMGAGDITTVGPAVLEVMKK